MEGCYRAHMLAEMHRHVTEEEAEVKHHEDCVEHMERVGAVGTDGAGGEVGPKANNAGQWELVPQS